jgi:hypothetical protein
MSERWQKVIYHTCGFLLCTVIVLLSMRLLGVL